MVKVSAKYDDAKSAAIVGEPVDVPIHKGEYEIMQTVTGSQFGNRYLEKRIIIENRVVTGLDLSNLRLYSLHPDLCKLSSLRSLDVGNNPFRQVSRIEVLGRLDLLTELKMERLSLTELPDYIGNLESLKDLNLSWGKFTFLPESIGNLNSLEDLNAAYNKIVSLPRDLLEMASLKNIIIHQNPLNNQAKSLLKELKQKGVTVSQT